MKRRILAGLATGLIGGALALGGAASAHSADGTISCGEGGTSWVVSWSDFFADGPNADHTWNYWVKVDGTQVAGGHSKGTWQDYGSGLSPYVPHTLEWWSDYPGQSGTRRSKACQDQPTTTTSTTVEETTTTTTTVKETTTTSAATSTTEATTTVPTTVEPTTSPSTAPPSSDCEGICNPGTVETTSPLPDDCIAGTTRWGILPCDPCQWITTPDGGQIWSSPSGEPCPPSTSILPERTTVAPTPVELPNTGIDWFYVFPFALAIAGAGAALVVVARRPRDPDERL